jgi:hypothetical protein
MRVITKAQPRLWLGLLLAISVTGCEEEPRYQDRPLSEWIRRLDDRSVAARKEAAEAIYNHPGDRLVASTRRFPVGLSGLSAPAPLVTCAVTLPCVAIHRTIRFDPDFGFTLRPSVVLSQRSLHGLRRHVDPDTGFIFAETQRVESIEQRSSEPVFRKVFHGIV